MPWLWVCSCFIILFIDIFASVHIKSLGGTVKTKTSAQKKQMVEKIIGRSLSESEVGNLILKSRLPDLGLQFEVGSAPKDIQIRK